MVKSTKINPALSFIKLKSNLPENFYEIINKNSRYVSNSNTIMNYDKKISNLSLIVLFYEIMNNRESSKPGYKVTFLITAIQFIFILFSFKDEIFLGSIYAGLFYLTSFALDSYLISMILIYFKSYLNEYDRKIKLMNFCTAMISDVYKTFLQPELSENKIKLDFSDSISLIL